MIRNAVEDKIDREYINTTINEIIDEISPRYENNHSAMSTHERNKYIFKSFYGLNGPEQSVEELVKTYGISETMIYGILKKFNRRLKDPKIQKKAEGLRKLLSEGNLLVSS